VALSEGGHGWRAFDAHAPNLGTECLECCVVIPRKAQVPLLQLGVSSFGIEKNTRAGPGVASLATLDTVLSLRQSGTRSPTWMASATRIRKRMIQLGNLPGPRALAHWEWGVMRWGHRSKKQRGTGQKASAQQTNRLKPGERGSQRPVVGRCPSLLKPRPASASVVAGRRFRTAC